MAFKVVLVDDDLLVLQDLETLADWGKYGFTIAQTFTNGMAALRAMKEIRPDFIVTDIRMPIMDGLQFVEKVRTMLPETKILLLTAYSDFDYAKKAIDLGVFNYLLKNELNKETLEEQLERIALDLMRNRDIKAAMVQKAFRKFLYDSESREHQEELSRELMENYGQAVGFFCITPVWSSQGERFAGNVCTAISDNRSVFSENGEELHIFCEIWKQRYVMVLLCMKRMPASRLETAGIVRKAAKTLSCCLQKWGDARVWYRQEGGILPNIEQAAGLLKELGEAVPYGIFAGNKKEVEISERLKLAEKDQWEEEREEELYQWFVSGEPDEIKGRLSEIQRAAEQRGSLKMVSAIGGAMENAVKEYVKHGRCSSEDVNEMQYLMKNFCDLRELFHKYKLLLEKIEEEEGEKEYSSRVVKVIRFIRKNYDKDISVGDAAQILGLNGEYLNKIFKKETGESFSRYLTQVRMEKARELLESGKFNVNEAAARTGYKSSQYFSITFRRYMGYSPSEAETHKGD